MNFLFTSCRFLKFGLVFLYIVHSSSVLAEPWIPSGNENSRQHIQVLADAGLIDLPISTWPLMWSGIKQQVKAIDISTLSEGHALSLQYLLHELRRAQEPLHGIQSFHFSNSQRGLMGYSKDSREQRESRSSIAYHQNNWAFKLQGSLVGNTIDDQRYRADGSYITGMWGNWAFGVGAIDRWWGPGWQSSLILSNAARPSPGVFINRVDSRALDLPILEWLGSWDFRLFLNQKEGDRIRSYPKLFGMRMSFKPFRKLEIGLSRTAQWGGEGRPEDWRSFGMMLIGHSNRGNHGIRLDGSNEPANQLAGYDWRLAHNSGAFSGAFYGQLIGEDEAGYMPYKYIGMAGVEVSVFLGKVHNRFALEASNTTMEFNKGGTPNSAYEHPGYPSGYRYRGRPLGASTDNDSELLTLTGFHSFSQGLTFTWTLGRGKINADGTQRDLEGAGNVFADEAVDLWYASAQYKAPLTDTSRITIGGQLYDNPLEIRGQRISNGVSLTYEWVLSR